MNTAATVIKKYPNRRLYNTTDSRYVNLEEIAALVREGRDLQVVDAQSGDDLTRVTLTQIIMEDARDQPTGLPLELLRQLIISSDRMGREFIMWYLKSAYDAYQTVQGKLHSGLSGVQSAALSPLTMMKNLMQGQTTSPQSNPDVELQKLRERIAELEARIEKPRRPRRAAASKTVKKKQKR